VPCQLVYTVPNGRGEPMSLAAWIRKGGRVSAAGPPADVAITSGALMTEHITLLYQGREFRLPLVTGSEKEKAIDISRLRQETGLITLESGLRPIPAAAPAPSPSWTGNGGSCATAGIPVEQLASAPPSRRLPFCSSTAALPTQKQLTHFSVLLNDHSLVHEDMKDLLPELSALFAPHGHFFRRW